MKILLTAFVVIFLFSVSGFSQEAVKVDEFGYTTCHGYLGKMSSLYINLNNNPDAKAYIFVYQGKLTKAIYDKKGKLKRIDNISPPKNQDKEIIGYLKRDVKFRSVPTDKIIFIEGGFREKFTIEFWLVPFGANPPQPTPTLSKIKQRKPIHHPYGYCGEI